MKRDIDLLYEIGSLRFTDRTWKQFIRGEVANNAEHSFRVAWLALLIARKEHAKEETVLKMALLHDLSETRTGDVNYVARMYTKRDDDTAYRDILAETSLEQDFGVLASEYKVRNTLEAKVVKDADNLEVDLEIQELMSQGNKMAEKWVSDRRAGVYPKLYTDTAKKLFDAIYNADPDTWHKNAKNRFNAGDFRPEL
jgi:putative hydrolase of HD superfamily